MQENVKADSSLLPQFLKFSVNHIFCIFKVASRISKPVGEEYMYYAAQNSKSCKLTALGYHYWRLVKEGKI